MLASVTIVNVGDAITAALPTPLVRILTGKTDSTLFSAEEKEYLEGSTKGTIQSVFVGLYADAAFRRLRERYEPALDAANPQSILVAEMDPTDRRAATVAAMTSFLGKIASLLNDKPPRYIREFGMLYVKLTRSSNSQAGKETFGVSWLVPNPEGGYNQLGGFGNVPGN